MQPDRSDAFLDLDCRVMASIRFHARQLQRRMAVPGMERPDYEQDLLLDLLRRLPSYDPTKASIRTFADRLIGHRIASLTAPTTRLAGERQWVPLEGQVDGDEDDFVDLAEVLPEDAPSLDETVGLRLDVQRLVGGLPPTLLRPYQIALADSVAAGAHEQGIHRSTAYDELKRLRLHAVQRGFDIYFPKPADTRDAPSVCGSYRPPSEIQVLTKPKPLLPNVAMDAKGFLRWLSEATPGQSVVYFRGFLALDTASFSGRVTEEVRNQLVALASEVMAASNGRQVHLLQRRHGYGDYSYIAVARSRHTARAVSRRKP
ncbi:MAG: hypothetical protein AB7G07_06745 [Bauldia sp.]